MFCGANSGTEKRRLGLLSVRKRTELSGGSFAIESVEGKATSIRATRPLKESC
jgi:signal transduction histidine kinase